MAPNKHPEADAVSIWSCENGPPAKFSLTHLRKAVEHYFGVPCRLVKLAEGGYHKVYDIVLSSTPSRSHQHIHALARVASPSFPKDKMRSEVATLQYIASHSSIPVPAILSWNADASNPVGAEYMILQKIPGTAAIDDWRKLPIAIKEKVVGQVAEHLTALFSMRFEKAGSLYHVPSTLGSSAKPSSTTSSPPRSSYEVGPVISGPFFRSLDGVLDYPNTDLHSPGSSSSTHLHKLRGPFHSAGAYLAHYLRALLFKCTEFPDQTMRELEDEDDDDSHHHKKKTSSQHHDSETKKLLHKAKTSLKKAIELCDLYPGDTPLYPQTVSTLKKPFTFMMDDFRLNNIMIDAKTGKVNGYIDFEGTTTAPLWLAATVPQWIPDPDSDMADWYGGSAEDQRRVWKVFHHKMDQYGGASGEWRKANKYGEPFRLLADYLELGVTAWASDDVEEWVDEHLKWAREKSHRGKPKPKPK